MKSTREEQSQLPRPDSATDEVLAYLDALRETNAILLVLLALALLSFAVPAKAQGVESFPPIEITLDQFAWRDVNANGEWDAEDLYAPYAQITCYVGHEHREITTDAQGLAYDVFRDVQPGADVYCSVFMKDGHGRVWVSDATIQDVGETSSWQIDYPLEQITSTLVFIPFVASS